MKKVRIVPMAAEHLNEVAALELACFSRPWSRQMLAEELDNQCAAFLVALEPETDKVIGYAGLLVAADEGISPTWRWIPPAADRAWRRSFCRYLTISPGATGWRS